MYFKLLELCYLMFRLCYLYTKCFDSEIYEAKWVPQNLNILIINGSADHITPLNLFNNNKLYHREKILTKEITGAGHYPWFENLLKWYRRFNNFLRL